MSKGRAGEWIAEGNKCYRLGKYPEAIECFDFALSADPDDSEALCGKANSLCAQGKASNAISLYDRALKSIPADSEILGYKGRALLELGNYGGALKCFDEALGKESANPDLWKNKAAVLDKIAQHAEADKCRSKAWELELKSRAGRWVAEGDDYCDEGMYADALARYDEALELEPKNVSALEGKGYAFSGLGKHKEALDCYDEVLKIEPKNAGALSGKGRALFELHKHQDALKCYDEALKITPEDPMLLDSKGVILAKIGKQKEAEACKKKAKELEQAARVRDLIAEGRDHYAAGDYSTAVECFDDVLDIVQGNVEALHLKGWALSSLEMYAGSIKCYDEALKIDPKNAGILNSKGDALFDLRKFNDAIKCYDEALKIDPKNVLYLCSKGDALFELDRYSDSLKCYGSAMDADAKDDRGFNRLKEKKELLEEACRNEADAFRAKFEEVKGRYGLGGAVATPQPKKEEIKKPQENPAPAKPAQHKPADKAQKPAESKPAVSRDPAIMEIIQAMTDIYAFMQQDISIETIPSNTSFSPQAYDNYVQLHKKLTPEQRKNMAGMPATIQAIRFVCKLDKSPQQRQKFKEAILQSYDFLFSPQNAQAGESNESRNIDEAVDQGFDSLKQMEIEINQLAREVDRARQSGDAATAARLQDELNKKRDRFNSKMSLYSSLSSALHDSTMNSIRNIK